MSKIRVCDVCGNVVSNPHWTLVKKSIWGYKEDGDICYECMTLIKEMREKKEDKSDDN